MNNNKKWHRIIAHVDMDAFFASIEQRDFPELKGKPVAVTNGLKSTCIITRSYEARKHGITTGMRLKVAKQLCPELVQRPARPHVYAEVSSQIIQALELLTPDIEVFSVDEAFLEFTHCRKLYRFPKQLAMKIKLLIWEVSQLICSVGISGDKTTAKFGSKQNKPNGLTIIPPWKAEKVLAPVLVNELCGIGNGITQFLAQYGVYRCKDMKKIPISILGKRFGNLGRRIWYMAQGKDPELLHKVTTAPKSIGHGKVMPPNTKDKATILFFLNHMSEKVAHRLRKNKLQAQWFVVGLKTNKNWLTSKCRTITATHDGHQIYAVAQQLVEAKWQGEGVHQCQITALDPQPAELQDDFFIPNDEKREKLNLIIDKINNHFGPNTLTNGVRMQNLNMPDVISPAWRPKGHRSTINFSKNSKTKIR